MLAVTKIRHDKSKMRGLEYHGKADGATKGVAIGRGSNVADNNLINAMNQTAKKKRSTASSELWRTHSVLVDHFAMKHHRLGIFH